MLRSKRYSENTTKAYADALKSFLTFCNNNISMFTERISIIIYGTKPTD